MTFIREAHFQPRKGHVEGDWLNGTRLYLPFALVCKGIPGRLRLGVDV